MRRNHCHGNVAKRVPLFSIKMPIVFYLKDFLVFNRLNVLFSNLLMITVILFLSKLLCNFKKNIFNSAPNRPHTKLSDLNYCNDSASVTMMLILLIIHNISNSVIKTLIRYFFNSCALYNIRRNSLYSYLFLLLTQYHTVYNMPVLMISTFTVCILLI